MKELKVGERITITLEVVEQDSCTGCFFDDNDMCSRLFPCGISDRPDGKSVIFKEVKK